MNIKLRKRIALTAVFTMAFVLLQPVTMSVKAQGSPARWTTVGSGGTVDEDSLAIVDLNNFTVGLGLGRPAPSRYVIR